MSRDAVDPVEEHVLACLEASGKRPFVAGICGAQGSGKSWLAAALADRLARTGLRVCTLSLDDLYLTRARREELARTVHPLLAVRGVPGTHDVALGLDLLDALGGEGPVSVPVFDKARDDRAPRALWRTVEAPVDLLLFEGWCVGALPQPEAALAIPVNALEAREDAQGVWRGYANTALATAYQELFARLDTLILLKAPGFDIVARWRMEQEETLRAGMARDGGSTDGVMDADAIRRFVSHYERLTRHILHEMPARADLVVALDEQRRTG